MLLLEETSETEDKKVRKERARKKQKRARSGLRDGAVNARGRKSMDAVKFCWRKTEMRNDVWLLGGAGCGLRMYGLPNKAKMMQRQQ